ncbi:MAG: hypothetical protein ABIP97_08940 [Chthoniobacterales bacterium]
MKTILYGIVLWMFVFVGVLHAGDTRARPEDIIQKDGVLNISDGSSIYAFRKDGTFSSFPVGMSGRVIKGTWKNEKGNDGGFLINGQWTWVNGLYSEGDFRTMKMYIYPLSRKTELVCIPKTKVYKAYFLIDELKSKHPARQ